MREILIVLVIVFGLVAIGFLTWIPWEQIIDWGWWTTGAGLLVGVPTGIIYHVQLYRVLSARSTLPRDWYWRPIKLNSTLTPQERPGVMVWCNIGALGFVVVLLGILMLGLGMVSAWVSIQS